MKTIAITGAAGSVGSGLRGPLLALGYRLLLLDIREIINCSENERSLVVDCTNKDLLVDAFKGVDGIVHLSACTTDAAWDQQVKLSIEGSIAVFEAAREAGVERIAYASSNHVVGLYPRVHDIDNKVQMRPDGRYGVGKAFGELISSLYAYKFGLKILAIRIGNANDKPIDRRRLGNWIWWNDLAQLISIGMEKEDLVYEVVYGVSDTTRRQFDNSRAYELGYKPQGRPDDYIAEVLAIDPPPVEGSEAAKALRETTFGGDFSQWEFVGTPDRLY